MALEDDVSELINTVEQLQSAVTNLSYDFNSILESISTLSNDIETIQTTVVDITTRMDSAEQLITTKADIDSPVFTGNPTSIFTPEPETEAFVSNTLATTAFVYSLMNNQPESTPQTPPTIQTPGEKINEPGGNNKNSLVGGGGRAGTGSPGGDGGGSPDGKGKKGDNGSDGIAGEPGYLRLYRIPVVDTTLNWDIGTYVHTPG
jgi:hypothetical protein